MKTRLLIIAIFCCAILFSPMLWQASASDCTRTSVGFTPLDDLGSGTYLGFPGGLYPIGMNQMPADHLAGGLIAASSIQPLNNQGQPSSSGKIALLSVGMSNTTQKFCAQRSGNQPVPCTPISFVGQATADPAVNHTTLALINGANGGQSAGTWDSPTESNYDRVRDFDLAQAGLTEVQVQVAWLKVANPNPTISLPASNADANILLSQMGNIVRAMKIRYPNLRIVYVSSRIYAGYASSSLNPEPYAYESGFSVKWLIEAQINQMRGAAPGPIAGNLNYNTVAPLLAWGPYPWADGMTPRSDGLVWQCSDLTSDGTHPADQGRQKVGTMLLNFFKNETTARSWFLAPRRNFADFDGDGKTDISIFRPGPGEWWYQRSSDLQVPALQFGASTDKIAPADFTGNGKTDIAFFRPSTGFWFILRSEDFSFFAFPFGVGTDIPIPADYDGDGKGDAAVFRPSTLTWFISKSTGGTDIVTFGASGDQPVVADYDGDGKADIAIFRPNGANGAEWWVRRSSNLSVFATQFGASTDKPVQGDYTGDGKADIAFWRPSTGFWFILRSEDSSFFSFPFGTTGDVPSPGDYDGDGKFDAGVFRPSETNWYVQRSTAGTLIQQFGQAGDLPVPNAFVR